MYLSFNINPPTPSFTIYLYTICFHGTRGVSFKLPVCIIGWIKRVGVLEKNLL